MRTERRPAPSLHSWTIGTSAPTDRITVTAATPRFIRRRVPSPTRRRTACRARSRCARPSRTGPSARPLELGAVPGRQSRLRGRPSRCRRATTSPRHAGRTAARRRGRCAVEGRTRRRMAGPPPVSHAEPDDGPAPLPPRRNPPRDWAAPPPWATGPGMSSGAGAAGAGAAGARRRTGAGAAGAAGAGTPPPQFLAEREARGLAGSTADRVAAGQSFVEPPRQPQAEAPQDDAPQGDPWHPSASPERAQEPDAELAGLVGGRPPRASSEPYVPRTYEDDPGQVRYEGARPPSRPPNRDPHGAPSWEQPKRYEAYPTIKTRASIPACRGSASWPPPSGSPRSPCSSCRRCLDLFGGSVAGRGAATSRRRPVPSNRWPRRRPSRLPPRPRSTSSNRATRCRRSRSASTSRSTT